MKDVSGAGQRQQFLRRSWEQTKPHHLADAIVATGVKLSDDEIAALKAPYVPHPVNGTVPHMQKYHRS